MVETATLTFEGELRPLLRRPWPDGVVTYPVTRRATLKDVIEALGPPHTEVHGLRVGGHEAGFDELLAAGQRVTVSPARFPIDPTVPTRLRPEPLVRLAFVCDANVGRLGRLLRLLGWDTAFHRDIADPDLAELARREGRVVLSRDRNCLKRSRIVHGRLVRDNDPLKQARDIQNAYGLGPHARPFTRCLRCNANLESVAKAEVLERLEPKTRRYYETFRRCPDCRQIYWAGSHRDGMQQLVKRLLLDAEATTGPFPGTGTDATGRCAGPDRR